MKAVRFRSFFAFALLMGGALSLVGGGACRRSGPEAPVAARGAPSTLEVLKEGRWLFTYVEPSGQFATTDKPEIIPPVARAVVRVFDPSNPKSDPAAKGGGAGQVHVADLNVLLKAGKAQARPLSREAFETAALAQLPPGETSALAARPTGAAADTPPLAQAGADAGLAPGTTPVVTIYGTSWCGACRAARQYLTERKIPFADKDVERDPAAARELADKASKLGVPTDRVPVIDVRGRLLLGFDRARIEALLGEST
jgi:glutaredoxin